MITSRRRISASAAMLMALAVAGCRSDPAAPAEPATCPATPLTNTPDALNSTLQPSEANTWQGKFPQRNARDDGFKASAPVGCFKPNALGLHDMIGNVWEWTADAYHATRPITPTPKDTGFDPRQPGVAVGVIKGGSYLCAPNYCMRYRPGARHAQDLTLGASHIGFRTARDA